VKEGQAVLILGEEIFLQIGDPKSNNIKSEVFLKYMGTDKTGLKMKGSFPSLWRKGDQELIGPELFNKEHIFKAVDIDYQRNLIWLRKLVINLKNRPLQFETEPLILEDLAGLMV
jgi:hypothetical protein